MFDRHRNLKVYKNRDYMLWNIYIDDVVEGWFQASQSKKSINQIINIGSGKPTTVKKLIKLINKKIKKVNYKSSKGTKDKSKDDQKMIKILMGDEVAPRKDFITNNALDVANLDI